jgi:UDP-N-acetylmuramoyl-tripeptide--D-alanyl-D-alanine ligase
MEARPLRFVAVACGGELIGGSGEVSVRRVCTDSRQAQAGDLFIALSGDRFDGHDFLADVLKRNVAAVMISRQRLAGIPAPGPTIVVEDTRKALGRLPSAVPTAKRPPKN